MSEQSIVVTDELIDKVAKTIAPVDPSWSHLTRINKEYWRSRARELLGVREPEPKWPSDETVKAFIEAMSIQVADYPSPEARIEEYRAALGRVIEAERKNDPVWLAARDVGDKWSACMQIAPFYSEREPADMALNKAIGKMVDLLMADSDAVVEAGLLNQEEVVDE